MTDIEINKKLYELHFYEEPNTLLSAIVDQAIETINPAQTLMELYRDKSLKYDLGEHFFIAYVEDIVTTIEDHPDSSLPSLTIENYTIELSYLAFQIRLQELLLSLGNITEEECVF